jgi:hypothetical protein
MGAQWAAGQALAHTLILWPVAMLEQGLMGVPEELLPGYRVYEAEVRIAMDEDQPAA